MFQSKSQKDMEHSENKKDETGDNDQTVNTRMEAYDRRDLTLDEIIALNKKEANENLDDEAKNNDKEQDRFKDYLKFSVEIAKAIEKAEENKGWDKRPVEIYLPEGKPITLMIGGETTDRDIADILDNSFGRDCLMVGIKNKKHKTRESATEWRIKDLEEANKTIGIIFR